MLILASASPRRAELIKKLGVPFEIDVSRYDEKPTGLSPADEAMFNARKKAEEVFSRRGGAVLGADTVVECDGKILGKPKDSEDARNMLHGIGGRSHRVITGLCIICGAETITDCDISVVTLGDMSEEEISRYVEGGSPLDKAGAYGLQDEFIAGKLISLQGSRDNVIGLPTEKLFELLKHFGGNL